MAWTSHGHQIPGTTVTPRSNSQLVARCGGPRICTQCQMDVASYRHAESVPPTSVFVQTFNEPMTADGQIIQRCFFHELRGPNTAPSTIVIGGFSVCTEHFKVVTVMLLRGLSNSEIVRVANREEYYDA